MTAIRLILASLFLGGPALVQATPLSQCEIAARVELASCPMPCCKKQAPKKCPELQKKAPQDLASAPGWSVQNPLGAVLFTLAPSPARPFAPSISLTPYTTGPPGQWRSLLHSGLSPPVNA